MDAARASFSLYLFGEVANVSALVRDRRMDEASRYIEILKQVVETEQKTYGLDQRAKDSFKRLAYEKMKIASTTQ